jgi:hypothetical protein
MIAVSGGAIAAGLFLWAIYPKTSQCPVRLPSQYKLLQHFDGAKSAELAQMLHSKYMRSVDVGTSESWLFEAPGSVLSAAVALLKPLHKQGLYYREFQHNLVVFRNIQGEPRVVIVPQRDAKGGVDPSRHRVMVNGDWQKPGLYERTLASLPEKWLDRLVK